MSLENIEILSLTPSESNSPPQTSHAQEGKVGCEHIPRGVYNLLLLNGTILDQDSITASTF